MVIQGVKVNQFILQEKRVDALGKQHQSGIYAITNIINGNQYIGQSHDLLKRKRDHIRELRNNSHHNPHLQNAFNCYGETNFKFTILELCPSDELNDREQHYIDCSYSVYNIIKDISEMVNMFIIRKENPDGRYQKDGETFTRPSWHRWVYGGGKNPNA